MKRMKGIKGPHQCPKCDRQFYDSEYDECEDLCVYCLYDGAGYSLPTEIDYSHGDPKNVTGTRKLLDNLDYIPEKQGKTASESLKQFKRKKRTPKNR